MHVHVRCVRLPFLEYDPKLPDQPSICQKGACIDVVILSAIACCFLVEESTEQEPAN